MTNSNTLLVELKGGLGNQLFQVAVGLSVSQRIGYKLIFDSRSFVNDNYLRKSILPIMFPELEESFDQRESQLVREDALPKNFNLDDLCKTVSEVNASVIGLSGYWQAATLVTYETREFFKERLESMATQEVLSIAAVINSEPSSVAVHFRREDYYHHGIVDEVYYIATLNWLSKIYSNPSIYVFTDSPNSVSHFLRTSNIPAAKLIKSDNAIFELFLFSKSHNCIIANSTFSWWGAFLSSARRVFYPTPWSRLHTPPPTLFPKTWARVESVLGQGGQLPELSKKVELADFEASEARFYSGNDTRGWQRGRMYCPGDATLETLFDAHYIYHTAWAARRLKINPVEEHVDIASDIRFVTLASSFQKILFGDYRPAKIELSNLRSVPINLLALPFKDQSLQSLSCMHVVEHVGLGRYGDSLDFNGHLKAISELKRVVAARGLLYFVTPVGVPSIVFHAHRIFSPFDIVKWFDGFDLIEFALITDDRRFFEGATLESAAVQRYGCGCFLFRRN